MSERTILIGDIPIEITRKRIKYLNLRVHAPDGHVKLSAPRSVRLRDVEAFVATRLEWIRRHRDRIRSQTPSLPPQFIDGELHHLWGIPHSLTVEERAGRENVSLDDGRLTLFVRPGSGVLRRARILQAWHKALLAEVLPPLIRMWEQQLNVRVKTYSLRRMKTRWGTCNPRTRHIRLNTELVTKPGHLLEYVLVHEMVHLVVPNHGSRFVAMMNEHYPTWREARRELNHITLTGGPNGGT